jgi:hypothetical protein
MHRHPPGLMKLLDCRDRRICLVGEGFDLEGERKPRPGYLRALCALEWLALKIARPSGTGALFWGRSIEELYTFMYAVMPRADAQSLLQVARVIKTHREARNRRVHLAYELYVAETLPSQWPQGVPMVALYPEIAMLDQLLARVGPRTPVLYLPWSEEEAHTQIITHDMTEVRLGET